LLPVSKTAYIKLFSRKGSGIKPDFRKLSMPDFRQTGLFPSVQLALLLFDFTGQQFLRAPLTCAGASDNETRLTTAKNVKGRALISRKVSA
jgi:hypothetical protein